MDASQSAPVARDSFDVLLSRLSAEHRRNTETMRQEIADLKAELAQRAPRPSAPGEGEGLATAAAAAAAASPAMLPAPSADDSNEFFFTAGGAAVESAAPVGVSEKEGLGAQSPNSATTSGTAAGSSGKPQAEAKSSRRMSLPRKDSTNSLARALDITTHVEHENHSPSRARLLRFVNGPFEVCMVCVVVVNAVVLIAELQLTGLELAANTGLTEAHPILNLPLLDVLQVLQHVINGMFIVEMIFKILVLRKRFFYWAHRYQFYNLVDLVIVLVCCLELYMVTFLEDSGTEGKFSVVRLVRLLRASWSLDRAGLTKLRLLVRTFVSGFGALFWSILVLAMFIVMGAVCLCQLVQNSLTHGDVDQDTRQIIFDSYGTSTRAMWTFFELTFSGGWPGFVAPLVERVSVGYVFFFVIYVSFVIFAGLRIATAVLIRETMEAAAKDAHLMVKVEMDAKQSYAKKLETFFSLTDVSGDGKVTLAEFQNMLDRPEVASYFKLLDLHYTDALTLFAMLDNGDGTVTYEEYLSGMLRIKGQARAMDVVAILQDCKRVLGKVHEIEGRCKEISDQVEQNTAVSEMNAKDIMQNAAAIQTNREALNAPGLPPVKFARAGLMVPL